MCGLLCLAGSLNPAPPHPQPYLSCLGQCLGATQPVDPWAWGSWSRLPDTSSPPRKSEPHLEISVGRSSQGRQQVPGGGLAFAARPRDSEPLPGVLGQPLRFPYRSYVSDFQMCPKAFSLCPEILGLSLVPRGKGSVLWTMWLLRVSPSLTPSEPSLSPKATLVLIGLRPGRTLCLGMSLTETGFLGGLKVSLAA